MKFLECYNHCRAQGNHVGFCARFCASKPAIPQPVSLKAVIHKATKCPLDHIYIRDAHLDTITVSDARAFLAQDKTDLQEYIKEKHDCDDFADRLYCAARAYFFKRDINVAWINLWGPSVIGLHAMNGFITKDNIHLIVEPQTDKIYTIKQYLRGPPFLEKV